jgi:esterase/lipase
LVPGTITFYPLRPPEQWTQRALGLFARLRGQPLPETFAEELLVESGLLFGKCDMDLRLGRAFPARPAWSALERAAIDRIFSRLQSLSDLFDLTQNPVRWVGKLTQRALRYHADALRDQWSGRLYRLLTVNLGHVLATLATLLVERGYQRIERDRFFRIAYLALDRLRRQDDLHQHDSLACCYRTRGLLQGQGEDLGLFLTMAQQAGLWQEHGDTLCLSDKITQPLPPHRTRLENPIRLLTNEAAPVVAIRRAISEACATELDMPALHRDQQLAWALMAEQERRLVEDRQRFSGPEMAAINRQETATADPAPYLLLPPRARPGVTQPQEPLGVLVVHGFLASPAELRPLGERIHQRGFPVMGVRLSGHGTSPWDLRQQTWQDWLDSLYQSWRILQPFCHKVAVVGFSTGGTLALTLAAAHPQGLAGIATIAAPLHFVDRRIGLVPWLHRLDEVTRWRPSADQDGLSFRPNHSEHPEINYAQIPLAALYQLHALTRALPRRLPQVHCPTLVIQGDHDPVVAPESAAQIIDALGSRDKRLHWVHATRHGLAQDQTGDTWEQVIGFLEVLRGQT